MIKLLYQPTVVKISKKAKHTAVQMYGEDLASLMFASLKNFETPKAKPVSGWQKFLNLFKTKTKLTLNVDNLTEDKFVVSASRSVGSMDFKGSKEPFPLYHSLRTLRSFEAAVLKSKESILKDIKKMNECKRTSVLNYVKSGPFIV